MSLLDYNEQKALSELYELLNKGIELLVNDNLDKDLYDAFEKYVCSTIKVVDAAFMTNYAQDFLSEGVNFPNYGCGTLGWRFSDPVISRIPTVPSYDCTIPLNCGLNYTTRFGVHNNEYKDKLKKLLQKIISLLKILIVR